MLLFSVDFVEHSGGQVSPAQPYDPTNQAGAGLPPAPRWATTPPSRHHGSWPANDTLAAAKFHRLSRPRPSPFGFRLAALLRHAPEMLAEPAVEALDHAVALRPEGLGEAWRAFQRATVRR